MWAPHARINTVSTAYDAEHFHFTSDKHRTLFPCPNPNTFNLLSQAHYFHKKSIHLPYSKLYVQSRILFLFLAEKWAEHHSHTIRRHAKDTRTKSWPARSATTSTGDNIHARNMTWKYYWQILEAPPQFQLTQKETAMVLLSPLPWAMSSPTWLWSWQGELVLATGLTEKYICKTKKVVGFHLGSSTRGEGLGTHRLSFHSCPQALWTHTLSYRCYWLWTLVRWLCSCDQDCNPA